MRPYTREEQILFMKCFVQNEIALFHPLWDKTSAVPDGWIERSFRAAWKGLVERSRPTLSIDFLAEIHRQEYYHQTLGKIADAQLSKAS